MIASSESKLYYLRKLVLSPMTVNLIFNQEHKATGINYNLDLSGLLLLALPGAKHASHTRSLGKLRGVE